MRSPLLTLALIGAALPLIAQDTRFTREMPVGSRLELENINGAMTLTAATGRTLEVVVTKNVKRGTGDKVKAILEESKGAVKVCTLDQQTQPTRTTCASTKSSDSKGSHDDVEMRYTVKVPTGVTIAVTTVNGNITATGVTKADKLDTVNGDIKFNGETAASLKTVNGSISANLSVTTGSLKAETVNGSVEVALPAAADARVRGQTVNGAVHSDFSQVTASGSYGPKSLAGQLGKGSSLVELNTVTGSLKLVKK